MTSLMSIFDPVTSVMYVSSWSVAVSFLLFILVLKYEFWVSISSIGVLMSSAMKSMLSEFKINKLIFVCLFVFILGTNLLGLIPLTFSPSSHFSYNMTMSLTLWLGMMIWFFHSNMSHLLAHLTPMGCPPLLIPFMVIIETISSLIRPFTLALRLMANVMAGHMILTLISKMVAQSGWFVCIPFYIILSGFLLFEFGVAFIQAYVFSSLMHLYWEESKLT